MEKQIKVILGSEYGDEGKTILARYWCLNSNNPISIILNSGYGESSHSIKRENDFSFDNCSFGAGSLDGYPTYFTSEATIAPGILEEQIRYFEKFMQKIPAFYINPHCKIETPIDFLMEKFCDNFDECDKKYFEYQYFLDNDNTEEILEQIYNNYRDYLKEKNIITPFEKIDFKHLSDFTHRDGEYGNQMEYGIKNFIIAINFLKKKFICSTINDMYEKYDTLIFEGQNGILTNDKYSIPTNFTKVNTFINKKLNNKNFIGECCYAISDSPKEDYNTIYKNCLNNFNIQEKNLNFDILSFSFANTNKCIIKENFDLFKKIYYFSNDFSESGIKIFYKGKKNNQNLTTIIMPHNHNSGLPYCLNYENKKHRYDKTLIMDKIGVYPFREDYPFIENTGSNIESICETQTYEKHLEFMLENFNFQDNLFLMLLNEKYLMDEEILKKYYMNYIGFQNFIVSSIEQAKQIKKINKNTLVYLLLKDKTPLTNIEEIKDIDGVISNDNKLDIKNKKFGILLDLKNSDDIYFKWNNNCDFFLLDYKKDQSFMDDINWIIKHIYHLKKVYDDFFGD